MRPIVNKTIEHLTILTKSHPNCLLSRSLSENREPTAEKLILARFPPDADEIRPVFHPFGGADVVQIRSRRICRLRALLHPSASMPLPSNYEKSDSKQLSLATASILGQAPSFLPSGWTGSLSKSSVLLRMSQKFSPEGEWATAFYDILLLKRARVKLY